MAKELETRIIDINVDEIQQKLINLNAEKIKVEDQINDLYDFSDKRLYNDKGYARIRTVYDNLRNKEIIFMTTKKLLSQDEFKVMEENEVIVDNKLMAQGIFKSLGLELTQSIKKYRESYKLKEGLVEIDINDTAFCPFPYIEIETDSVAHLKEIVEALGYTLKDTTSKTIYDLIKEYNSK